MEVAMRLQDIRLRELQARPLAEVQSHVVVSPAAKQLMDVVQASPYYCTVLLGTSDNLPLVEATGDLPYMLPPSVPYFNGKTEAAP
ncbi:hypothetical protein BGZ73_003554 [Actinomortierella ambigua]|nr:hypothetical protein BGZ73_003554 [Actinomortierella ambigua]